MHQNPQIKMNKLNVENIKIASHSTLRCENITIKNAEFNIPIHHFDGYQLNSIYGNISGVPNSIKLNIDSNLVLLNRYYQKGEINIIFGYNQEFFDNCDKWAKVYNDNPTDQYYNYAKCNILDNCAVFSIDHKDIKPPNKKNGKTGLIVGVVIACVVVVGIVVFLLIYFLKIKKGKDKSSAEGANE